MDFLEAQFLLFEAGFWELLEGGPMKSSFWSLKSLEEGLTTRFRWSCGAYQDLEPREFSFIVRFFF